MGYDVRLTSRAARDLKRLDNSVRTPVIKALEKLASDPEAGKPLQPPLKDLYSFRAGDYRIIYKIYKGELVVVVISVGHRREVYERLRGLLKK